jgi:hypothetical protein
MGRLSHPFFLCTHLQFASRTIFDFIVVHPEAVEHDSQVMFEWTSSCCVPADWLRARTAQQASSRMDVVENIMFRASSILSKTHLDLLVCKNSGGRQEKS